MKRNKNLIELSKDHHHGLLLGWKLKQGLKGKADLDEMADYVIHFSKEALLPHFNEEENKVLPYLDADDSYRKRTLAEHAELRAIIGKICIKGLTNSLLLTTLAEKLEAHIRFEERELFPYMESKLPIQQLEEMGKLITDVHHPYVEAYCNEFWTR